MMTSTPYFKFIISPPPPCRCGPLSCLILAVLHFPLLCDFNKQCRPGGRFDHLIGLARIIWLLLTNFPCPCSPRHGQPCTPFRLHSTYTRPPYPGATPSSPPSLHHLRAFSLLVPTRAPTSPHYHDCLGACLNVLTRVPGPPIGVTRLGSPASPRIVPVDAAACRAYRRDPGGRNHS